MKTLTVDSRSEFSSLISDLTERVDGPVALDVETEPFDGFKLPWELRLEGIGFYTPNLHAFAWAGSVSKEDLQRLVSSKMLLMHNARFDLHVLSGLGIDVGKSDVHDTLTMAWLADENGSLRLKDLARSVLKRRKVVKFDDVGKRPEGGTLFGDRDDAELEEWRRRMAEYCVDDCLYTYELFGTLKPVLEDEGLWNTYDLVERPMGQLVRSMERTGISIDADVLRKVGDKLDEELRDTSAELERAAPGLNPGSPKQLREHFYTEKGHRIPEDFLTPKGEPSTNAEALRWLEEHAKDPVAGMVLNWRERSKVRSTYVDGILGKLRHGTLHASFNPVGTKTGRFSSSNPNCQNIPARDDEFDIRRAFVPRPGHLFVCADYSQIELRVSAYFSDCRPMIEAYRDGADIHAATAAKMGCERKVAKAINFSIIYGTSAYGLARRMKMDKDEAQAFIDEYFRQFPEILKFMSTCVALVRRDGFVRTICGRKRRFPDYARALKSDDWKAAKAMERQMANSVVQGSSADIIKLAMKSVDSRVRSYGGQILLTVHDEVLVEVPETEAERCMADVKDLMEGVMRLGDVPLLVEPKVAERWVK